MGKSRQDMSLDRSVDMSKSSLERQESKSNFFGFKDTPTLKSSKYDSENCFKDTPKLDLQDWTLKVTLLTHE